MTTKETKVDYKHLNSMMKSIQKWTANITYGEMQEIAIDEKKLILLERLYKELSRWLNDIDVLSKELKK